MIVSIRHTQSITHLMCNRLKGRIFRGKIRLEIPNGEQAGIGSYVTYIRKVIGGGNTDRHYRRNLRHFRSRSQEAEAAESAHPCAVIPLTTFGWGWRSGWRKGPIHAPEFRRKYSSRARPLSVSR